MIRVLLLALAMLFHAAASATEEASDLTKMVAQALAPINVITAGQKDSAVVVGLLLDGKNTKLPTITTILKQLHGLAWPNQVEKYAVVISDTPEHTTGLFIVTAKQLDYLVKTDDIDTFYRRIKVGLGNNFLLRKEARLYGWNKQ